MKSKDQETEELKLLLVAFSQLVTDNNIAIRESMARVDSLLKHAVAILNESFFSANHSIANKELIAAPTGDSISSEISGESLLGTLQKALVLARQLNVTLSKTTQSLQVEDIVSQIVVQVNNNTIKLDSIIKSIHQVVNLHDGNQQLVEEINCVRMNLANNSVRQSSLNEGGVELF